MPDWLITGCSQLLTLRGPVPRRGKALGELGIIRDGAILIHEDRIAAIGPRRRIEKMPKPRAAPRNSTSQGASSFQASSIPTRT